MLNDQDSTFEEEESLEDIYDHEITDTDYGFVFSSDGDLKSVFMPSEFFEVPEKVLLIFKMFGIEHPEDLVEHTLQ